MKDWKSTWAGILSFFTVTLTTISGVLAALNVTGAVQTGQPITVSSIHGITWIVIGVNTALALCRAWIGWLTNNADASAAALALNQLARAPGTGSPFIASDLSQTPAAPSIPKIAGVLLFIFLVSSLATGCMTFERATFNTLTVSKSVIDTAQQDYTNKKIPENACTYAVINDAKGLQVAGVDSLLVYEAVKLAGRDVTAQTVTLEETLANLAPLVAQIKTLYTNPSACVAPKIGATS